MKLLIHDRLNNPVEIQATRVVVLDQYDNPIAFALQTDPEIIIVESAAEAGQVAFNATLRNLGIDKTVLVTDVKQKPLKDIVIPNA